MSLGHHPSYFHKSLSPKSQQFSPLDQQEGSYSPTGVQGARELGEGA